MNTRNNCYFGTGARALASIALAIVSIFAGTGAPEAGAALLAADLRLAVAASAGTVVLGAETTYTVTVCNDGPDAALTPTVTRAFPGGTLVAATPSAKIDCRTGQTFSLTSQLEPGFGIRFTDTVRADATGTLNYRAFTSGFNFPDPNPANNDVTVPTIVEAPPQVPPVVTVVPGGACGADGSGTVNIAFSAANAPVLIAASSDQSVVPDSGLVLSDLGVDGQRTLTITPAAHAVGRAIVTVIVSDGTTSAAVTLDVKIGSPHADLLTGGDGFDVLFGNGGRDVLIGGAGHDLLCGGRGRDTLTGGSGGDVLGGGAGRDEIVDFNAAEGDTSDE